MDKAFRIIDANINRACEGLRVIEDWFRFSQEDADLTARLKHLRHSIRNSLRQFDDEFIRHRLMENDVGLSISQNEDAGEKKDIITANFKRAQEALRVIEENLQQLGYSQSAKQFEQYRFNLYALEKAVQNAAIKKRKQDMLATDIYGITASEFSNGRPNVDVVKAMIDAGVRIIQYRAKEKSMKEKFSECEKIRELTQKAGVCLIVNDHADLALLVGADGVHLGQDDLPPEKVRKLVGAEMIIGLSTHSPQQAGEAVAKGVDYIGVGPLFTTYTKKDVCPPVGLAYLQYVAKNIPLPFVAIGGIKEDNLAQVIRHGASCVAMVTEIVGAEDIGKKIKTLRKIINEEKERNGL